MPPSCCAAWWGQNGWSGVIPGKRNELVLLALAGAVALFAPNTQTLLQQAQIARADAEAGRAFWRWTPGAAAATALIFVISILHLSHISEFLYFQF